MIFPSKGVCRECGHNADDDIISMANSGARIHGLESSNQELIERVAQFDHAIRRIVVALGIMDACGGVDTDNRGGHTAEVIERRALELISLIDDAQEKLAAREARIESMLCKCANGVCSATSPVKNCRLALSETSDNTALNGYVASALEKAFVKAALEMHELGEGQSLTSLICAKGAEFSAEWRAKK